MKKIDEINPKANIVDQGVKKKAPLKSELSLQLKVLQGKFDALEDENRQNVETIKILNIAGKSPVLQSIQVQTDEILLCHKCDYEPEDVYDLVARTYSSCISSDRVKKIVGNFRLIQVGNWSFYHGPSRYDGPLSILLFHLRHLLDQSEQSRTLEAPL